MAELDGSNAVSAWQAWGPTGLVARRQVLSNNAGPGALATTAIYQYDPRGNVVHRLNADGTQHRLSASTPLSNYGHSAWGERLNEGTTGLNYGRSDGPVGFGGQFGYATDVETGLILCGFRYYDPQNGRWLTRDPISYDGGVNVYAYVGNNPIGYVDPSGLQYEPSDAPSRIHGPWTKSDMARGLRGLSPRDFGGPINLHHGGQMPGSGVHEIPVSSHTAELHPNKASLSAIPWTRVTSEMRSVETPCHWRYRALEMGAGNVYPELVNPPISRAPNPILGKAMSGLNVVGLPLMILDFVVHHRDYERMGGSPPTWEEAKRECPSCIAENPAPKHDVKGFSQRLVKNSLGKGHTAEGSKQSKGAHDFQ